MTTGNPNFDAYFFRLLFKVKIFEASGTSFQDLASQIFEWSFPGFQRIAPWGRAGDGGNDGWLPSEGHYYQIYGPTAASNWNPPQAVQKAESDFQKLLNSQSGVRRYSFVLNDRYTGIPAPVTQSLEKIKTAHGLEASKAIGAGELTDMFMAFPDDKKCLITGNVPSCQPDFIDARAVGELLTYLTDKPSRSIGFLHDLAPDFEQKIIFNGLTAHVGNVLRVSSYQTTSVDEFLRARGVGLQQAIAQEIQKLYADSIEAIPNNGSDTADMRFIWISQKLIPPNVPQHPHTEKAYEWASYAILAKYFETCDAYDHPSSTHTT